MCGAIRIVFQMTCWLSDWQMFCLVKLRSKCADFRLYIISQGNITDLQMHVLFWIHGNVVRGFKVFV